MKLHPFILTFISSCFISVTAIAQSMDDAYSQGQNFGNANQSQTQQDAENPDYNTIPNYEGTNVPEANYSGDLTEQARQAILAGKDPTGKTINQSIANNPEQAAPSQVVNTANTIQSSATNTLTNKIYCHDDSCTDTTYKPEDKATFAESVSALSGAFEAGVDAQTHANIKAWLFNKHLMMTMQTFTGDNLQCREMGFIDGGQYDNCCSDSGWGQKVGLAGCNQEENTLWDDKGKDWCVYVGEYCSNKNKSR